MPGVNFRGIWSTGQEWTSKLGQTLRLRFGQFLQQFSLLGLHHLVTGTIISVKNLRAAITSASSRFGGIMSACSQNMYYDLVIT